MEKERIMAAARHEVYHRQMARGHNKRVGKEVSSGRFGPQASHVEYKESEGWEARSEPGGTLHHHRVEEKWVIWTSKV